MNEQLKEIAVKAKVEHCVSHDRLQEFAELIIRECALVVHKKTGPKSALNVLEHFGVEE
jgi:hypothetical protein